MRANKFRFFLDIFPYTHSISLCRCLVFLFKRDMHEFMVFQFSIKPARWVTFRGLFRWSWCRCSARVVRFV
jgi:hypothetical protein